MISVNEAINFIKNSPIHREIIEIPLREAATCILAENIKSPINMPPFRQSAMDGYGIAAIDKNEFEIINEVKAGDHENYALLENQAVKIFTGSKVPSAVNAIVQIEKCTKKENKIHIAQAAEWNQNIRAIGEQIKKNEIALQKGTHLTPAAIGFLASLGITTVTVFKKPSIGIIITGNELAQPDAPLPDGMVYESNGVMLEVAVKNYVSQQITYQVKDNLLQTADIIKQALEEHDVIILSGGISVGDYDFVYQGLSQNNVEILFYKVNQKPGKPLLFGKKEQKYIFALPGNPAASLTCFYMYVLPLIKRMYGYDEGFYNSQKAAINHNLIVKNTTDMFLKAQFNTNQVAVLSHQNSSMLNSFSIANCLLYVEAGEYEIEKGNLVTLFPL